MTRQKELLLKRFTKSLEFYENEAIVQKEMAEKLIFLLIKIGGKNFDKIFEVGCGTGILTKESLKNLHFNEFFANDIVLECNQYLKKISDKIHFIGGDIEEINLPEELDLVISNATFQWLNHPEDFFKKTYYSLKRNGILCFSTFGKKNFLEFQSLSYPTLKYYEPEEIKEMSSNYFNLKFFKEEIKRLHFPSVKAILIHIKKTGVNSITNFKWSISAFENFIKEYEKRFKTINGVSLTYHPVYYYFERI